MLRGGWDEHGGHDPAEQAEQECSDHADPRIDGTLPLTVRTESITGKTVAWPALGHPSRRTANLELILAASRPVPIACDRKPANSFILTIVKAEGRMKELLRSG
jgi:hypothetical protein